ncbi:MAG: acyl-CoA dehydrogenase family protein [Acidobacteriota bacterium]|nr:acyl-CoA dehydrogenase family protein [Acidobacteriota bacterium]
MDFELTEEQKMVIDGAKKFTEKELAPGMEERDEKGEFNLAAFKALGQLGYLGMTVPEAYGGTELGAVAYVGAIMEFSKADNGLAVAVSVQNSLVNDALLMFGTDEQKQTYLPKLTSGEWIGCFSLTEADAGSDPAGVRASAVRDGDEFVLNGAKTFVSNGDPADLVIGFFSTDKEKGAKGISAILVPKTTPGLAVGKHENKMGIRTSSTTELIFTDCRVPAANLLGQENKGLSIALATLDCGRLGIAAQAVGIAEAALEESIRYSKERVQFGKPIAHQQAVQFMLADMAVDVEVAKSMLYRVAWMKDKGDRRFTAEAAMIKLFASEMSHRVCHKAIQVHGGYGYMKEYKVERLYRDQRITEIYEGTSEIQRLVIARSLLS